MTSAQKRQFPEGVCLIQLIAPSVPEGLEHLVTEFRSKILRVELDDPSIESHGQELMFFRLIHVEVSLELFYPVRKGHSIRQSKTWANGNSPGLCHSHQL